MIHLHPYGWPLHLEPSDPWDGTSTLPDDATSWEDHTTWSPRPLSDPERYAATDLRWQELAWQVLRGERPLHDPELQQVCEDLGIWGARSHDGRLLPQAPHNPSVHLQIDLVENWAPDLAAAGTDFVLGPYADMAPSRDLARLSAAIMLWARVHLNGRRTFDAWSRDEVLPELSERRAMKALGRAPPMLWDASTPIWRPLLPLMSNAYPDQAVEGTIVPLTEDPVQAVVARIVPLADGRWVAHGALGLPAVPPRSVLIGRITLALWRARRANRRITWEDVLRARPEVLYRTCAIACWEQREETGAC